MIQIALCTDNSYAMPAGVMMYSVLKNHPAARFHVIVPQDFSDSNRKKMESVAGQFGASVSFITIDNSIFGGFPIYREDQPGHISIAAYYRLFLTDLLPATVDKVLYLDCDLICRSSLQELWDTDLTGCPLACVQDIPFSGISEAIRLGYDETLGYFNSGVLLINLEYWRRNNAKQLFTDFVNDHLDLVRYHDQDVLNCVFRGQVKFVHPRFNAQDRLFHRHNMGALPYPDIEVTEARTNPAIVHFTYRNKPWILGCSHPYTPLFISYKKETPWRGTRLKPKKAIGLKSLLVNLLVRLRLYRYHDDYIDISGTDIL